MVIKSKKEKIKLAMHRDFLERKNKMHERYPLSEIRRLQIQQGFSNINDPKLINMLVPPKKSTDGFGDDLGFDDFDPEKGIYSNKIEPVRNVLYTTIQKQNNSLREMEHPKLVLIEPDEDDVNLGWLFRYFIQQANSPTAPLTEIDKDQYDGWLKIGGGIDRAFYNGIIVKWRIRGTLEGKTIDGIYRKGVIEGNKASIDLAAEDLPAIANQITNYVKWWKR